MGYIHVTHLLYKPAKAVLICSRKSWWTCFSTAAKRKKQGAFCVGTGILTLFNQLASLMIPSPCIRHCCLDPEDICLGCFRSLEEILLWGQASETQKQQIVINMQNRQQTGNAKKLLMTPNVNRSNCK